MSIVKDVSVIHWKKTFQVKKTKMAVEETGGDPKPQRPPFTQLRGILNGGKIQGERGG